MYTTTTHSPQPRLLQRPQLSGVFEDISALLTDTRATMESVQSLDTQIQRYTPFLIGSLAFIGVGLVLVAIRRN